MAGVNLLAGGGGYVQLKTATVSWRVFLCLAGVAFLLLLSACPSPGGGADTIAAVTPSVKQTPTPIPEASPTVAPTETPEPTATPAPTRKDTEVENRVLLAIMTCAGQLAAATGSTISPDFETTYDSIDGTWRIDAFSKTPALTFGTWNVDDDTGAVTPEDGTAQGISTPDLQCLPALARRARGRTPPIFGPPSAPTPTPLPKATPLPRRVIGSEEQAELAVWVTTYSCFGNYPFLSSFSAEPDGPVRWIVEGRSTDTVYGLWTVNAINGEITPNDQVARQAQQQCEETPEVPAAMRASQAALRVWMATYQCFDPPPPNNFFVGHLITPQRWIVEGREAKEKDAEGFIIETKVKTDELFGFWLVDTDTGVISPWDRLAIDTAARPCFKQP